MSNDLDFEELADRAKNHAETLQLFLHHGLEDAIRTGGGGEGLSRALGGTALHLFYSLGELERVHEKEVTEARGMGLSLFGTKLSAHGEHARRMLYVFWKELEKADFHTEEVDRILEDATTKILSVVNLAEEAEAKSRAEGPGDVSEAIRQSGAKRGEDNERAELLRRTLGILTGPECVQKQRVLDRLEALEARKRTPAGDAA